MESLCPAGLLTADVLTGVFQQYNNESAQVITSGSTSIVCDDLTQLDAEHYFDFSSGKVVRVDPVAQRVVDDDVADVAAPEAPARLGEQRAAVEAELAEYVTSQFVKGTTALNVCAVGADRLVVLISGEKLNLKNYWAGRWRSKFTVHVGAKKVEGAIKARIHYFEDGNVQMNTDKVVEAEPVSFSDAASLAKQVRRVIVTNESKAQDSLEEMYINMSNETFKDMRRVLPITRQKMDWSGAQMQLAKGFTK